MLLANFGSVSSDILKKLFTHCTNFYGVALCNVRSKGFNNLHTLWRKAVKRILRLPLEPRGQVHQGDVKKTSYNRNVGREYV